MPEEKPELGIARPVGKSSNPAPLMVSLPHSNGHCSLNENLAPKIYSAPKLCHLLVTWCCHLHRDPLPLEQRAGACKEQLCAARPAGQRGRTLSSRDRSHQLLQGQLIPRGLLTLFWAVLWSWIHLRQCCSQESPQSKPKSSLPLQSCTVSQETCSHYGLFPTWLLPFQMEFWNFPESCRVTKTSLKQSLSECLFPLCTVPLGALIQNGGASILQEGKQTPGTEKGKVYQTQTLPAARQEDRVKRERSVHHLAVPSSIKNNKSGEGGKKF